MQGYMYLKEHATKTCTSGKVTTCCVPMDQCQSTCNRLSPRRRRQVVTGGAVAPANPNESPAYVNWAQYKTYT